VLQHRAFAALALVIISLLGMAGMLGLGDVRRAVVVLAVALAIGVLGLWLAFTAMSRSRNAGTARPRFSMLASVLGVAGTGLSTIVLVGYALFWPQISQYSNCMSGANTVATQDACNQQLDSSLQSGARLLGR
jgi:hypothetical protein